MAEADYKCAHDLLETSSVAAGDRERIWRGNPINNAGCRRVERPVCRERRPRQDVGGERGKEIPWRRPGIEKPAQPVERGPVPENSAKALRRKSNVEPAAPARRRLVH